MKIAAYTVGDIKVASARLRSFYLFHSASNYGFEVFRDLSIWQSIDCKYLHLQGCYTPRFVLHAIIFRLLGKRVFFDVNDMPTRKRHFIFFVIMTKIANIVLVALETTKNYLTKYVDFSKIFVFPTVIDVNPNKINKLFFVRNENSRGIFWIGHPGNLISIEEFMNIIRFRHEYRLIVCTKLTEIKSYIKKYPWVTFIDWNVDSALDCKLDIGYCILNHAGCSQALLRGDSKMILAIAVGLIPIVSRTPAYENLAKVLDAERLIFNELAEVFVIIEKLDKMWKRDFFDRCKSYILSNHTSDHVFSLFASKFLC
ncbi:MAG: hypothetical protein HQL10_06080 [Nitrospirae bacterium]|nr:hypothetical protein [Nitrospirota bacterium]